MSGDPETRHHQAQAVTMLAIATGALGFGLFGAEFRVSTELLPTMMFAAGGLALVVYAGLPGSVRRILTRSDVSGEDVVRGPLSRMFLVMFHVVAIFAIGIFDSPVGRG